MDYSFKAAIAPESFIVLFKTLIILTMHRRDIGLLENVKKKVPWLITITSKSKLKVK